MLNAYIAHKHISLLHGLTFYAVLDDLFVLLDTHNAHKNISFLHGLTLYDVLDLPLSLLDKDIGRKDVYFFMNRLSVLIETKVFIVV